MEIYNGTYCVYIHTNKTDGKKYAGQTVYGDNPRKRWNNGNGYKNSTYFYNAIQKYGWDNFEHEVVATNLTANEADNFERLLIEKLDLMNPDKGYNLVSGGTKNKTLSESTKKKIGEAHIGIFAGENNPMYGISPKERMDEDTYAVWREKLINTTTSDEFRQQARERNIGKKYSEEVNQKKGKNGIEHPMYGKHHSEETKNKISHANVGKKMSEESKRKISEATTGDKNPFYGKTHSEEARRKMSESRQGSKNHKATMVLQCDMTGLPICVWGYIKMAANELNINNNCIGGCCKGLQKTAGGYKWYYVYDQTMRDGTTIQGAISLGYITEEDIQCLEF